MIEVCNLEERLDSRSFLDLLLRHALCNLQWFPSDSSYYAMTVLANINAVIESLDNHTLLSGIAAIEHDHNLTWLQAANQNLESAHTQHVIFVLIRFLIVFTQRNAWINLMIQLIVRRNWRIVIWLVLA